MSILPDSPQSSKRYRHPENPRHWWILVAVLALSITAPLHAGDGGASGKAVPGAAEPQIGYAKHALQGFNLRYWLSNQMCLGLQAWDLDVPADEPFGLEYPVGSGIEHLFGGGPWLGAIVGGTALVTEGYNGDNAQKYFRPGVAHLRELIWRTSTWERPTEPNLRGHDDDGDGAVDEDDLDGLDNDGDWSAAFDDIGADGVPDSMEVGCKGGFDAGLNPDPAYDNYDPSKRDSCSPDGAGLYPTMGDPDLYTEGNSIPDHGEPRVDEDYGAMSDNDLYCSARDDYNNGPIEHAPMGARVTQRSYAWHPGSSAEAISILEYTFRNEDTVDWVDPYLAFFADADVGPPGTGAYWGRNYTCFIDSVRMAYTHNPVDLASTPLGVAAVGASKPIDSLGIVFDWYDMTNNPMPGSVDSLLYQEISGGPFPDPPANPCGSESNLGDTRFLISAGPFDTISPGEEATIAFALVSGETVGEMARHASRARRIYDAGGYVSPAARVESFGAGSVTIGWDDVRSPFGTTTGYRLYHGTAPSAYTDSQQTAGLSVVFPLSDTGMHYFAVAALDDAGRRSALSDEVSLAPLAPGGLLVTGEQRSIDLSWRRGTSPDIAGYNIYRSSMPDTALSRINAGPVTDTVYRDPDVSGYLTYRYAVTAVNALGFEGPLSGERSGRLIPPLPPARFLIGPAPGFVRLEWEPNQEDDLAGYHVFRVEAGDTTLLTPVLLSAAGYTDSTASPGISYEYFVEAVDSSLATGRTPVLPGSTVPRDRAILVVYDIGPPLSFGDTQARIATLMQGFDYATVTGNGMNNPVTVFTYAPFSTIVWIQDTDYPQIYAGRTYPLAMGGYLAGGGRLIVAGRNMTAVAYPENFRFLDRYFSIGPFVGIDTTANFAGALGEAGYPPVAIDSLALPATGGRAKLVETFPRVPDELVIYRYRSDPFDSTREGKPVGIRASAPGVTATYLSFPVFYLDTTDARTMLRTLLTEYGEIWVGVSDGAGELPTAFRLYDAYPNPFNPSTTIRFDVPGSARVRLSLFDVLGRELAPLLDEDLPPGRHELRWDASEMASGIYYVRMTHEGGAAADDASGGFRKLLLVK